MLMAQKIVEYYFLKTNPNSNETINKIFQTLKSFDDKRTDKRLKYVEFANIVDKMSVTEFMFLYNIFYSANNKERLYEYKLYECKSNNSMTSDTFEDILNMSVSSYCSVGTKLKRLVLRRYNELNEMYTRKELFDIIKDEEETNLNKNETIENDEEFDIETNWN